MKSGLIGVVVIVTTALFKLQAGVTVEDAWMRGDVNGDGEINISDPTALGNYLHAGGQQPDCLAACDVNADGSVDVSDQIYSYNYLFSGGPAPYGPVSCF